MITAFWLIVIACATFWLGTIFATAILTYAEAVDSEKPNAFSLFGYYWESWGHGHRKTRAAITVLIWAICPILLAFCWICMLYIRHLSKKQEREKEETLKRMAEFAKPFSNR